MPPIGRQPAPNLRHRRDQMHKNAPRQTRRKKRKRAVSKAVKAARALRPDTGVPSRSTSAIDFNKASKRQWTNTASKASKRQWTNTASKASKRQWQNKR